MSKTQFDLALSLDELRPLLESAASESGVVLDFLMRKWNGRFATYNVGRPTEEIFDTRRSVHHQARYYKLLGRLKANTRGDLLHLSLHPPTSCDLTPTAEEERLWQQFVQTLTSRFE